MHLQALDDATDVHKTSEDSLLGWLLKINPLDDKELQYIVLFFHISSLIVGFSMLIL